MTFEALLISKNENGQSVEWKTITEADLMPGDVTVRVTHSTINYKDGLAITGKAPVVRRWPMIPGVDFAGVVASSEHPNFNPGDAVFLNGCGLGEMHYGGYSQYARVPGDWLLHIPEGLTPESCMIIGTAGYTSMLAVMALEHNGVKPEDGPILVTGAAGGVGSVAVALLAKLGYSVTASSGRMEIANALKALGATDVVPRSEFAGTPRPLAKERWAGAIDVVGSLTLANILAQTRYGGTVAACGLVQGIDLPTSVAPFILRAVTLAGVESVMTPKPKREAAWKRLAQDLDLAKMHAMTETHPLRDVVDLAPEIVAGRVRGRVLLVVAEPEPAAVVAAAEAVVAEAEAETLDVEEEAEAQVAAEPLPEPEPKLKPFEPDVVELAPETAEVDVAAEPEETAEPKETAEPEQPAEPEPAAISQPEAAEPQTEAAQPEPVVAEPQPEPVTAEPPAEAAEPEAAAAEPAPETVEPASKPEATESEPVADDPVPFSISGTAAVKPDGS